jgi:N-acetylmuramoyl-L-alanine amidase
MLNVPEYIIVHHTGGTKADPLADTSHHTLETIDAWHKARGWEGVGYHYVIEKDGKIRKGREENYHGAHSKPVNTRSLGICLAGNFDLTLPTIEQEKSLSGLLKGILSRYNIPLEKILPHRAFSEKSCYGRRLPDDWARNLIAENYSSALVIEVLDEIEEKVEQIRKLLA